MKLCELWMRSVMGGVEPCVEGNNKFKMVNFLLLPWICTYICSTYMLVYMMYDYLIVVIVEGVCIEMS